MNVSEDIKNAISMQETCKRYGIETDAHGFARCPFHDEKTASFKAYPGSGGFHCFGCGAHGSVIDFAMRYFSLDYSGACEKLNADFGLGLPIGRMPTLREKRQAEQKAKQHRERMQAEQNLREAVERDYYSALDEYARLSAQKRDYRPKWIAEELHPLYIEACQKLAIAEYQLEQAEGKLYDLKRRCHRNT